MVYTPVQMPAGANNPQTATQPLQQLGMQQIPALQPLGLLGQQPQQQQRQGGKGGGGKGLGRVIGANEGMTQLMLNAETSRQAEVQQKMLADQKAAEEARQEAKFQSLVSEWKTMANETRETQKQENQKLLQQLGARSAFTPRTGKARSANWEDTLVDSDDDLIAPAPL